MIAREDGIIQSIRELIRFAEDSIKKLEGYYWKSVGIIRMREIISPWQTVPGSTRTTTTGVNCRCEPSGTGDYTGYVPPSMIMK
jgi:hypothetical protein